MKQHSIFLFLGTDEMIENALREIRDKINDQVGERYLCFTF